MNLMSSTTTNRQNVFFHHGGGGVVGTGGGGVGLLKTIVEDKEDDVVDTTTRRTGVIIVNNTFPPSTTTATTGIDDEVSFANKKTGVDDDEEGKLIKIENDPKREKINFRCHCWAGTWNNRPGYCSILHQNEFPNWLEKEWFRTYLQEDGKSMVNHAIPCQNKCGRAAKRGSKVCCNNCQNNMMMTCPPAAGVVHQNHTCECEEEWREVRCNGGYCKLTR